MSEFCQSAESRKERVLSILLRTAKNGRRSEHRRRVAGNKSMQSHLLIVCMYVISIHDSS